MLASVTGVSIAVLAVVAPPFVVDVAPPPPPQPSPPQPMSPGTGASAVETSDSPSFLIAISIGIALGIALPALALVFVCRRRCRPDKNNSSMTGPAVVVGVPVPPGAQGTEMSSDRSYGRPYSGSRPVASEPDFSSVTKI
jgi:hypothetical protein